YLKRFRHGLVAHMPTKAIFSAAKRLASYTREAKIKSKTGSHSLGVNASFFRHRQSGHRILLATNHTFPPQRVGGSESSIHNLSVALLGKGFNVSVFSTWSADEAGAEQYVAAA